MGADAQGVIRELYDDVTSEMIRSHAAIMAVALERGVQRLEFPPAADDALEPSEWIARLAKHVGRAVSLDPQEFRRELVVVGALALAAIESFDRKFAYGKGGAA